MPTDQCQNPTCNQTIEITPGHRRRKYCNDACKQNAFRARELAAEQVRIAEQEREAERRAIEALRAAWGDLDIDTLQLLREIQNKSWMLAERIGRAIKFEREHIESITKARIFTLEQIEQHLRQRVKELERQLDSVHANSQT